MRIGGACGVVFAAATLTLGAVPGREHPVVRPSSSVEGLEATVAAHPEDVTAQTALARAYLEADAPGLAMSALASVPTRRQEEPQVQHVAARVLIEQGRANEALELERSVLSTCGSDPYAVDAAKGCDFWLIVSANRRSAILQELVHAGVEDAIAEPEASLVAYHKATHETRLVAE